MPRPGQETTHVHTGDRIRYLEVGERFRAELTRKPVKYSHGEHYHAVQTESFEVLAGQARYVAGGVEGTLQTGDRISFPPGTSHVNPWGVGDAELRIIQELSPGLDFDVLHATLIAGAVKGHVRADGSAKLLPQAVTLHSTRSKVYTARLPQWVQVALFAALAPIGRLMGYRYGTDD